MWRICEKRRIRDKNPEELQIYQWAVWFLIRVDNESTTRVSFSTRCWWAAKEPKVCGKENAQDFVLKINYQIKNGPSLYPPSEISVWIFPSQPVQGEEFTLTKSFFISPFLDHGDRLVTKCNKICSVGTLSQYSCLPVPTCAQKLWLASDDLEKLLSGCLSHCLAQCPMPHNILRYGHDGSRGNCFWKYPELSQR